ncbi:MAG: M36 family metallopeptidase [Blastocatellia bacterium]
MSEIKITSHSRVTHDSHSRALRTWFDTTAQPAAKTSFSPRDLAHQTLRDSAHLFAWKADLPDLHDHSVLTGQGEVSVRFTQVFKDVPVDSSEVVVNMYADGRIHSIYNNYHYDIPEGLDPGKIKIKAETARQMIDRIAQQFPNHKVSEPKLIVYQYRHIENHPKHRDTNMTRQAFRQTVEAAREAQAVSDIPEGTYYLAWDIRLNVHNPTQNWRILIDAMSGRIIPVIDLLQYDTGTGQVFDPNPIVTSGNTALSSASSIMTIDNERVGVTIERLDPPSGGNLKLHGSYVQMENIATPNVAEPLSPTGNFSFSYAAAEFLDTMVYFHLDRFQNYIQTTLGMNNVANFSIHADPQGDSGGDNSFYDPTSKKIEYGGGIEPPPGFNPIPDAGDAMVILHEYGHAIQDNVNPGFDNPPAGTGEGFGDFLAAVYYDDKHAVPANTRGIMMSWDANPTDNSWSGRRYDVNWLFGDANYNMQNEAHYHGQFWCASMFELYRKLGGDSQYAWVKSAARDLAIRLHLMANFLVPASNSTATQMAQQVEAADSNLGGWRYANGLHKKVIYDTFRRRNLPSFPALSVDVYINDGRKGGYGSLTGNDLFTEKLFLDNYWSTQDLWVTVVPYANNADQQAGDPGDHVEPPVGSPAYLYVRVKNKGASGSGPVTVKAYHSDPTIGLVWPADWTPNDTPSLSVSNIPASDKHVFGPFPWTPTHVGHECVFAIAECANDHAVTQDLLVSDIVAHADLVPFDNNIAQRNLYPTAAKGKMVRGFWVSNPTFESAVVNLQFESTLPRGWTFHSNLANTEAIHLAARERRWVEITIDQAGGAEITDFTNPPSLTISGTIGGKLIGGMSFYAAPPSAFPAAPVQPPCEVKPSQLCCFNIPWNDFEFEGEIDLKLRFRSKK